MIESPNPRLSPILHSENYIFLITFSLFVFKKCQNMSILTNISKLIQWFEREKVNKLRFAFIVSVTMIMRIWYNELLHERFWWLHHLPKQRDPKKLWRTWRRILTWLFDIVDRRSGRKSSLPLNHHTSGNCKRLPWPMSSWKIKQMYNNYYLQSCYNYFFNEAVAKNAEEKYLGKGVEQIAEDSGGVLGNTINLCCLVRKQS